ncbi:cobalt transport protein [Calditerrivibrio nitroreducens DSM 19672]|uniref:Cobalt transport protein n=2 Tax=Calditerrivibrio nitroreducens TaxID=477976 RepID=E4TEU7_CALNY|nr:cobalt transport protein [Calditerrivibrio nitroreducens DSM 19672]
MNTQKTLQFLIDIEEMPSKGGLMTMISPFFKILLFIFFSVINVSINKYDLVKSLFLTTYCVYIFFISPITLRYLSKIILYSSLFILSIAILNPLFDKNIYTLSGYTINAGVISALNIYIKFLNIVIITSSIISSTRFSDIVNSLKILKLPQEIALSMTIMYRFLFLFLSDIIQTIEAISSRNKSYNKLNYKYMKNIISSMFQRALYRSESIYEAILSKGGLNFSVKKQIDVSLRDLVFLTISMIYITIIRVI